MAGELGRGQPSDYRGYGPLMAVGDPAARVLLGDRGYDADFIRKVVSHRVV